VWVIVLIRDNTPVEYYQIKECPVLVKREDLSAISPLPPFSKVRGVYPHMVELKKMGVDTVGYVETSISMAGIAVSVLGQKLGIKVVIFDPQYKQDNEVLIKHRSKWKEFGAELLPIKAGMAKVNWNIARKVMKSYPNSILLPLGLPFKETIEETAKEVQRTDLTGIKSLIVSVGSGTICAGVLKGIGNKGPNIYGVLCRKGNISKKRKKIFLGSGVLDIGIDFILIDMGYEYTDRVDMEIPFPCNPYYDGKAFKWLVDNIDKTPKPVMFWNIGE